MADKQSRGVSKEASIVRRKIIERNLEHCFPLEPNQVETIIELYKEYEQSKPVSERLRVQIDIKDSAKLLKSTQREIRKAIKELKEIESKLNENKLLVIKVDDIDSVPTIHYKGEHIKHLSDVSMMWKTKTLEPGQFEFNIHYYDTNGKTPVGKTIGESKVL